MRKEQHNRVQVKGSIHTYDVIPNIDSLLKEWVLNHLVLQMRLQNTVKHLRQRFLQKQFQPW